MSDVINPVQARNGLAHSLGYVAFIVMHNNDLLCRDCFATEFDHLVDGFEKHAAGKHVSKDQLISSVQINYENDSLFCSSCSKQIEPSYDI